MCQGVFYFHLTRPRLPSAGHQEPEWSARQSAFAGEHAVLQEKLRALQENKHHLDVAMEVLGDARLKHYAYQSLSCYIYKHWFSAS